MKYHLGLRHNRHMLRLIKEEPSNAHPSYQLGRAYGNDLDALNSKELNANGFSEGGIEPSHKRRRILDDWGIQNQSPRRPEPPNTGEALPRRSQRALFYQLHEHEQALLCKRLQSSPQTRRDVMPGTKARMHLGKDHVVLNVESYPTINNPRSKI